MGRVASFDGEYRFLSNFYAAPVMMDGEVYRTVEHAFQAAKTLDPARRREIQAASTPGEAKRLGHAVELRPGWDEMRVEVMTDLCRAKFTNDQLRKALLSTGGMELVEGNTWGDTFWGVCRGKGQNQLGKILMKLRDEFRWG